MATWLTQTDIESAIGEAKLIEYLDDDSDHVVDATVIAALLDKAEKRVEGFLQAYTIPVAAPWPAALVDLGVRQALKLCHERRPATYTDQERDLDADLTSELEAIRDGGHQISGLALKTLSSTHEERASADEPVFILGSDGSDPLSGY